MTGAISEAPGVTPVMHDPAARTRLPARESAPPVRVQLKRTKGWRMPPNTVKVDRTTKWGNPFVVGKPAPIGPTKGQIVADRRQAYLLFRALAPLDACLVARARAELAGKNLACWCPCDDATEDQCHAAVLLQIANTG
jgi:hypothetical protein